MQVRLAEDAKVLLPNAEHQNFTESSEVIPAGTVLNGEVKVIKGLRRKEPFDYRLFMTDDNKLIYLNKTRTMEATEVKLGADATKTPTVVNLKQSTLARPTILGAIGGAVIGFGYAKYKKHDMKKAAIFAIAGGLAGFIVGKVIAHTATVKAGK